MRTDLKAAFEEARLKRMNDGLVSLAEWASARSAGPHNPDTTLTMLRRKAAELDERSMAAGYRAVKTLAKNAEQT